MLLKVERLKKSFGGAAVLKELSLEVGRTLPGGRGEVTCLIGPNGAGKTTLVDVVTGFQRPSGDGERLVSVTFRREPILGLAPWQITEKGIRRTWQGAAGIIPDLTVLDNLILGMTPRRSGLAGLMYNWLPVGRKVRSRVEEVVSREGCEYLLGRLDDRADTLSYGWRKVLDVLRTTFLPGSLYIYDEPFSGLDPEKLTIIEMIIGELSEAGKSVLFIEHIRSEAMRATVSRLAHRMVAIAQGKVISDGAPARVFEDPEVVSSYTGADDTPGGGHSAGGARTVGADILKLRGVSISYGDVNVINDLSASFKVGRRYLVVGPNGAGKSSLLKGISGAGAVTKGDVIVNGRRVTDQAVYERARGGVAYVPQEGAIFPSLKCADNLRLAMPAGLPSEERKSRLNHVFELFPELRGLMPKRAGALSGGEAKKLALSMAMIRRPSLLLLDELSIGLDRRSIADVYELVGRLHQAGVTIIIVEQNYQLPLRSSDCVIGLREGKVCFIDNPSSFTQAIQQALFTGAPIPQAGEAPSVVTSAQR